MQISPANTVHYRRLLFSASDCFLDGKPVLTSDINYFIQVPYNFEGALSEFYTLLIDLRQPLGDIWQGVYHRTRSEIRSFLKNQQYEHQVAFNLSPDKLNTFIGMFNRFSELKKIRAAETFRLKAYNEAGLLAVSFVRQQQRLVCINFYRVNRQRATNLYSFHLKHELNGLLNNTQLGRAHRALHWLDLLEFRKMGVECYDFCGWYSGQADRHLLNINAFKEQFTRQKVKEYSGVIYKNLVLKTLLRLRP